MGIEKQSGKAKNALILIVMISLVLGLVSQVYAGEWGLFQRLFEPFQKKGKLSLEVDRLKMQLDKAQLDANNFKEAFQKLQENMLVSRDVKYLDSLRQDKKKVEGELAKINKEFKDVSFKLNKSTQKNSSLKSRIENLELQFNRSKWVEKYKKKEAEIHDLGQKNRDLENKLIQNQAQSHEMQNKIMALEGQITQLEQQIINHDSWAQTLVKENQKSNQDYEAMYSRFNEIVLKDASLEKEINNLKQETLVKDDEVKKKQDRITYLEQEVNRLTSERDVTKVERDSLKEDLGIAREATAYLNKQFFQVKQSLEDKTTELSRLKEELKSINTERDGLKAQLSSALDNQKKIDMELGQAMEIVSSLQNRLKDASGLLEITPTPISKGEPKIGVTLIPEVDKASQIKSQEEPSRPEVNVKSEKEQEVSIPEGASHYNQGLQFAQEGDYQQAVKEFKKVIEVDPQDADSYYNLAVIYDIYLKDKKEAINYYQKYLELRPQAEDAEMIKERLRNIGQ